MVTQKEGCNRRCRGQKREESIAYATTTGLVVMNCREEKGKMLELKIRKGKQIEEEGSSNVKTKESEKRREIILNGL